MKENDTRKFETKGTITLTYTGYEYFAQWDVQTNYNGIMDMGERILKKVE